MVKEFEVLGAAIVGISPDSPASHRAFAKRHDLAVTLLSDPDHAAAEAFGAWGLKKSYGKETTGLIRSTFLIDPSGTVRRAWRSVKVKGHAEAVLAALRDLTADD